MMRIPWILVFAGMLISTQVSAEVIVVTHGQQVQRKLFADGTTFVDDIHTARKLTRQKIKQGLNEDLHVMVLSGVIRVEKPLTFTPEDGGNKHRVIWSSASNGSNARAVISGGKIIDNFKDRGDGIWVADLPQVKAGNWRFRELFVNAKRRTRARFPNQGFLRIDQPYPDKRSGFTFKVGEIPKNITGEDIELVFFHDWSTTRVGVKQLEHDKGRLTTKAPVGPAANHYRIDHFEKHPRYYLENALSMLDEPGEWYLDEKTGKLYYKPFPGEVIGQTIIEAPYAKSLLEVKGTPDQPVRNLHFVGLGFEYCRWDIPKHGYAGSQACFHENRDGAINEDGRDRNILRHFVPASVTFTMVEDCSIRSCRFEHMGGVGVELGMRSHRNLFEGNIIRDVSGNGLMLGEDRSRRVDGKLWHDAAPDQTATANVVRNNLIEHVGQQFYGSVGIWAGITRESRIEHNVVRYTPYTGISIGWIWNPKPTSARDNILSHNHIHHVMQKLSDGGGIYTLGRQPGSVLRGNHVHDVPVNIGRAESNGFFMDEGTTDMLVEDNVFYRIAKSPLRFHRATVNLVRNNVLVCKPGQPGIRYNTTKPEDIKKVDNIVYEGDTPNEKAQPTMRKAGLTDAYRYLLKE